MKGQQGDIFLCPPNFLVPEEGVVLPTPSFPQVLSVAGLRSPGPREGNTCKGELTSVGPLSCPYGRNRSPRASELGEGNWKTQPHWAPTSEGSGEPGTRTWDCWS